MAITKNAELKNAKNEQTITPESGANVNNGNTPESGAEQKPESGEQKPDTGAEQKTPETPKTREQLHSEFIAAKKSLSEIEERLNYDVDNVEIKNAERVVFDAKNALKKFDAEIEKQKLELEMNEKLENAKTVLNDHLQITPERLTEMQKPEFADTLKSIKWAFALVFGGAELHIKSGVSGKSLTSGAAKTPESNGAATESGDTRSINLIVKDLFDSGYTRTELINMGHSDGRLRNVVNKIGYRYEKASDKFFPKQ